LHRELAPRGIRVTALCPGPVPTEFQARAGIGGRHFSGILARTAASVAEDGYHGFVRGRRVVVPGFPNKVATTLMRIVPRGLLLTLADATQNGRRPTPRV
jgi:short-subunit dehydrogenase